MYRVFEKITYLRMYAAYTPNIHGIIRELVIYYFNSCILTLNYKLSHKKTKAWALN